MRLDLLYFSNIQITIYYIGEYWIIKPYMKGRYSIMGSFERLLPIVNPRRMLGTLNTLTHISTEDEISKIVEDANRQITKNTEPTQGSSSDASILFQNFIVRFFTEIQSIGKVDLVQYDDNDTELGIGIFVRTATAKSFEEYADARKYLAIHPEDGTKLINAIDNAILFWKNLENEMLQNLYSHIQDLLKRPMHEGSVYRFANLMKEISTTKDNRVTPRDVKHISETYAACLVQTSILEWGIVSFIRFVFAIHKKLLTSDQILSYPCILKKYIDKIVPFDNHILTESIDNPYSQTFVPIYALQTSVRYQSFNYFLVKNRDAIRDWCCNLF